MDKYGVNSIDDIIVRLTLAFEKIHGKPIKEEEKK